LDTDGRPAAGSAAPVAHKPFERGKPIGLGLAAMSFVLAAVAWPYANGPRHIGHLSGFGVPSDVFSRYMRMAGHDVLMVSGTDEHGTPIQVQADKEGATPRELADRYNRVIVEDLHGLGLSYDLFTRTTTGNHYAVVQELFETLHRNGYILPKTTLGAISPSTGRTLPDRYIEGTCPICGFDGARGDQCDNCGNQLDPPDLINPRSKINGERPEFIEAEHFFLDLPAFAEALGKWLDSRDGWRSNVLRFSRNLLDDLQPRAITRDLDWGVPIPLDGWRDRDDKRIYVWFDAVIGYLSAAIEWAAIRGEPDAWREWWQNPEARHYYFMGKDNITFHTVIWPSMLIGYGAGGEFGAGRGELQLPYDVVASEFLTMEGKQFSTSRNVVIYIRDFLSRYDADALRFYITAAGPETHDSDFTWAEFVRRNNDELVAAWGNLVNRTLTNAYRNFGEVPQPGELTAEDQALLDRVSGGFNSIGELIATSRFKAALNEALALARDSNQYLSDEAPWAKLENDRDRAGTILYTALRAIDGLKILFTPFLPHSSQQLHELLGYEGWIAGPLEFREVEEDDGSTHTVLTGDYYRWVGRWEPSELPPGQKLREPKQLFKKLDAETVVAEELARLQESAQAA
jgi:methionyl-tRNA synthetase